MRQDYTKDDNAYYSANEYIGEYTVNGGSPYYYNGENHDGVHEFNRFLEFYVYNIYEPKTYPVKIKKVDAANPSADTGLAGAKFDLYGPYESSLSEDDARKAIKVNDIAIVTLGDGIVSIGDLQSGYYYLYETKAPDGYIKLSDPVEIVVDSSKENDQHAEISYTQTYNGQATLSPEGHSIEPPSRRNGDCYVLTVTNTAGAKLPSTGGVGTGVYYAFGTLLVLAAVALMIARRRAQEEE